MLVNGGAAVNIMPYTTYRKLGLGEDDLIQTDMMLKDFDGAVAPAQGQFVLTWRLEARLCQPRSSSSTARDPTVHSQAEIGFTLAVASHLQCISVWSNGLETPWKSSMLTHHSASQRLIWKFGVVTVSDAYPEKSGKEGS